MRILGLTGSARSGKDSIADYLCSEYEWTRLSFAAPLKRMVVALLNRDEDWIEEHKEEHVNGLASPRRLLQTLGTEWGRHMIDTNIWVNLVHHDLNDILMKLPGHFTGVVLTDCRFNNEAEWIKACDGEIWQVVRPDIFEVADHPSEFGIDSHLIDRILLNDTTLLNLHNLIERNI